jgi:hypothetical protein
MRIYDIPDQAGQVFAFEVKNWYLTRSTACKIASKISGARVIKRPKFLSDFREEEFCAFELDGVTFVMWEPFGDSNVYWIGPAEPRPVPELEIVREAFAQW